MSIQDDIRGALAATSGAARRSMALSALGLPEDDLATLRGFLDDATSSLMEAIGILRAHGIEATGTNSIVSSAKQTQGGWQSEVYGGRKPTTVSKIMEEQRAKTAAYERRAAARAQPDISHPWRSEERQ